MFSSKLNYEENFSNGQWNPMDQDLENEMELLIEMEKGEGLDCGFDL